LLRCSGVRAAARSFPTRRSSDLICWLVGAGQHPVTFGIDAYGDGIILAGVQGVEYPDRGDNRYGVFWRLAAKKNEHIFGHSRASGFRSRPSSSEAMSLISMVPATTALIASAMGISTSTVWARVTTA